MRLRALAFAAAATFGAVVSQANASVLSDRIWLESYLSFPLEDVAFTASAMGYLGRVKEASILVNLGGGALPAVKRKTAVRFYEDGRAAEEVDTDPSTGQILFQASYRYNARNQIATIIRNNYEAKEIETVEFAYDAKSDLSGATVDRNGVVKKRFAIATTSSGQPKEVVTLLPDGRALARVTYTYSDGAVTIDYSGDFGAARVTTSFKLDAQGRPIAAETQRRDDAPEVDYDGHYTYTYLANGDKLFHGVETHPNAQPHPSECVKDAEFFPNGGAKSTKTAGDDITCPDTSSTHPEVEFDQQGNFKHTRLGRNERFYDIEYFGAPSM